MWEKCIKRRKSTCKSQGGYFIIEEPQKGKKEETREKGKRISNRA